MEDEQATVASIVLAYLTKHGYDGLYSEAGQCGCSKADLMVCEAAGTGDCKPGYKVDDPTGEFDYRIVPEKEAQGSDDA